MAPFWLHVRGPEAPETIQTRFWKASEGSLEFQLIFAAILAKKAPLSLPTRRNVQGRWEMFRDWQRLAETSEFDLTRRGSPTWQGADSPKNLLFQALRIPLGHAHFAGPSGFVSAVRRTMYAVCCVLYMLHAEC